MNNPQPFADTFLDESLVKSYSPPKSDPHPVNFGTLLLNANRDYINKIIDARLAEEPKYDKE